MRWLTWLQLAPGSIYFVTFFVVPMAGIVAMSFFRAEDFDFIADFQLGNYREVITSEVNRKLLVRTLRLSVIITALVIGISYPFAYVINFVFRRQRQFLYFAVLVSLFGGFLVRIYAWRTILGREGVVNQALEKVGLIDEPISGLLNSQLAVGIAMSNFLIPLGILPIYSAMQNVEPTLIDAARDLGASRFRAARQVVLPLSMQGVRVSAAFVFVATMAEWVTPTVLGGPGDQLIANRISFHFGPDFNWPEGSALAVVLVVAMIICATGIMSSLKRVAR